jgi:hypothetical protein
MTEKRGSGVTKELAAVGEGQTPGGLSSGDTRPMHALPEIIHKDEQQEPASSATRQRHDVVEMNTPFSEANAALKKSLETYVATLRKKLGASVGEELRAGKRNDLFEAIAMRVACYVAYELSNEKRNALLGNDVLKESAFAMPELIDAVETYTEEAIPENTPEEIRKQVMMEVEQNMGVILDSVLKKIPTLPQ